MTGYEIHRTGDGTFELRNPAGDTIQTYGAPFDPPDDVVPAILDDLGVADPSLRAAFELAVTGTVQVIDDRPGTP